MQTNMKSLRFVFVDDEFERAIEGLITTIDNVYYGPLRRLSGNTGAQQYAAVKFRDAGTAIDWLRAQADAVDVLVLDVQLDKFGSLTDEATIVAAQKELFGSIRNRLSEGLALALDGEDGLTTMSLKGGWFLWSEVVRLARRGEIRMPRRIVVVTGSGNLQREPASVHAFMANSGLAEFAEKSMHGVAEDAIKREYVYPAIRRVMNEAVSLASVIGAEEQLRGSDEISEALRVASNEFSGGWSLVRLLPWAFEALHDLAATTPLDDDQRADVRSLFRAEKNTVLAAFRELREKGSLAALLYRLRGDQNTALCTISHTDRTWWIEGGFGGESDAAYSLYDRHRDLVTKAEGELAVFQESDEFYRYCVATLKPWKELSDAWQGKTATGVRTAACRVLTTWLSAWGRIDSGRISAWLEGLANDLAREAPDGVEVVTDLSFHSAESFFTALVPRVDLNDLQGSSRRDPLDRVTEMFECFLSSVREHFLASKIALATLIESDYLWLLCGHNGEEDSVRRVPLLGNVAYLNMVANRITLGPHGGLARAAAAARGWIDVELVIANAGVVNLQTGVIHEEVSPAIVTWLREQTCTAALVQRLWISRS